MAAPTRVQIIDLDPGGGPTNRGLHIVGVGSRVVFSVRPNTRIDFATLAIWTNCPLESDDPFLRFTFHRLEGSDEDTVNGDWQAFVDVRMAGAFEYFAEFDKFVDGTCVSLAPRARDAAAAGEQSPPAAAAAAAAVGAPAPSRRGPLCRFVVHPELSVQLMRTPHVAATRTVSSIEDARANSTNCDSDLAELLPGFVPPLPGKLTGAARHNVAVALPVALEGITLQTQLTRCLGPVDSWLYFQQVGLGGAGVQLVGSLAEPLACRFNMLHFTPVQQLGGSGSAYSIGDQLKLDKDLFQGNKYVEDAIRQVLPRVRVRMPVPPAGSAVAAAVAVNGCTPPLGAAEACEAQVWAHPVVEAAKSRVLNAVLRQLEGRHGVLSMVDIVLNHTSTDSAWLARHPEAAYSLQNSPHLRAAFELDESILRVSAAIERGAVAGVGAAMRDEGTVAACVDVLQHHATLGLPASRIWEYYTCDVTGSMAAAFLLYPDSDPSEAAGGAAGPGVAMQAEDLCRLTQADNVEGGDVKAHLPPAPIVTGGVAPAELSVERRLEIACCRHPAVSALTALFNKVGYPSGSGPGIVHVSDSTLDSLALGLIRSRPPPLDTDMALQRLRSITTQSVMGAASQKWSRSRSDGRSELVPAASVEGLQEVPTTSTDDEGEFDGLSMSPVGPLLSAPGSRISVGAKAAHPLTLTLRSPDLEFLPRPPTTPSATPAVDATALPASNARHHSQHGLAVARGGIPSAAGHKSFDADVSVDASGRSPRPRDARADAIHTGRQLPSFLVAEHEGSSRAGRTLRPPRDAAQRPARSESRSGRPPPEYLSRAAIGSYAASGNSGAVSTRHGFAISPLQPSFGFTATPSSSDSLTPSDSGTNGPVNSHAAVFNDGTGSRFAVHVDLNQAIAALNTLPGVHIDPAQWMWPSGADLSKFVASVSSNAPSPVADTHLQEIVLHACTSSKNEASLGLFPSLFLLRRLLQGVNLHLYRRHDADIAAALGSIRGTAAYQWLGILKGKGRLSPSRPLVYSYFSRIPASTAKSGALETHVLCCNGFIWNGDPEVDFTLPVDAAAEYAKLLRAGTSEVAYIQKKASADKEHPPPSVAGRQTVPGVPGGDLLELPASTLKKYLAAYDAGDANRGDELLVSSCDELLHPFVISTPDSLLGIEGDLYESSPKNDVTGIAHDEDGETDADTLLHLHPDVLPLPLVCASTPYLRRDIVIWGDCVKLRFGLTPYDSLWLWCYMALYTRRMARLFSAFRLDNAHGTPMHVAATMLDIARSVRPNLYVNAELFTGSIERDVEFIGRLGINSLVREAMQVSGPGDLVGHLYGYGGAPVASLRPAMKGASAAARLVDSGGLLPREDSSAAVASDESEPQQPPLVHSASSLFAAQELIAPALSRILSLPDTLSGLRPEDALLEGPRTPGRSDVGDIGLAIWRTPGSASARSARRSPRAASSSAFSRHPVLTCVSGFCIPSAPLDRFSSGGKVRRETLGNTDGVNTFSLLAAALLQSSEAAVSTVLPASLPTLLFDCTHDNPTPAEKRHPVDALAAASIVSGAVCATGTTRGFDLAVPVNPSVVTDYRLYEPALFSAQPAHCGSATAAAVDAATTAGHATTEKGVHGAVLDASLPASYAAAVWAASRQDDAAAWCPVPFGVPLQRGFCLLRRRLNLLKQELAARGHSEIYVACASAPNGSDIVTIVRSHPVLPTSYVIIARTAFSRYAGEARTSASSAMPAITIEGRVTGVVLAAAARVPAPTAIGAAPEGRLLQYRSVLDPLHACNRPAERLPADNILEACGAVWDRAPASRAGSLASEFVADPLAVNGLPISLEYRDDSMARMYCTGDPLPTAAGFTRSSVCGGSAFGAAWNDLVCGLASLQETDRDGHTVVSASATAATGAGKGAGASPPAAAQVPIVYSRLSLDPVRFQAGSVLVLKVRAPRNVTVNDPLPVTREGPAAAAPTIPGSSSRRTALARELHGPHVLLVAGAAAGLSGGSLHRLGGSAGGGLTPNNRNNSFGSFSEALLHPETLLTEEEDGEAQATRSPVVAALFGSSSSSSSSLELSAAAATPPPTGGAGSTATEPPGGPLPLLRGLGAGGASGADSLQLGPPLQALYDALVGNGAVTLASLNVLLYRCDAEERDDSGGARGVYTVPDMGPLPWAGIAGVVPALRHARKWNDMGHPLLENVRRGDWLLDYTLARLQQPQQQQPRGGGGCPGLAGVAAWLGAHFALLRRLPPGLKPQAFDHLVSAVFAAAVTAALLRMSASPLMTPAHHCRDHLHHHLHHSPLLSLHAAAGATPSGATPSAAASLAPHHLSASLQGQRFLVGVAAIPMEPADDDGEEAVSTYKEGDEEKEEAAAEKEEQAQLAFAAGVVDGEIGQRVAAGVVDLPRSSDLCRVDSTDAPRARDGSQRQQPGAAARVGGGVGVGGRPEWLESHSDPSSPLPLTTALAMTSVQLWSATASAPLLALPLLLDGPGSPGGSGVSGPAASVPSLAAGVDHFCTGYMRVWGRDTFIALRGLLLVTGRYAEARTTILAFASVTRHGLVPNLMDGGRNPRFNCRDAAWWFLQAVRDYCALAPEGCGLLRARVQRRFPSDREEDYDAGSGAYVRGPAPAACTLADVVYDIVARHAAGVYFREWRAGPAIDSQMRDAGFDVSVEVDEATGFVHGGNEWNCGTWMDKMGSDRAHGTNGVPATPRDGADIEIVGLSYSVLRWLQALAEGEEGSPGEGTDRRRHHVHLFEGAAASPVSGGTPAAAAAAVTTPLSAEADAESHHHHHHCGRCSYRFPHTGVAFRSGARATFGEWARRIAASFQTHFYIPRSPADDGAHALDARLVNARGVYKDTVGSSAGWADYQLRPNQLVAMAVADELFDASDAAGALDVIERQLLGDRQMGVKTLDPADWAYRGDYDNGNAGPDRACTQGFNYHQGPEWLWPYGYWLRARMRFPPQAAAASAAAASGGGPWRHIAPCRWASTESLRRWVAVRLHAQRQHLDTCANGGLPELTNAGGAHCRDSCASQAWSSSTLLDALFDVHVLMAAATPPPPQVAALP